MAEEVSLVRNGKNKKRDGYDVYNGCLQEPAPTAIVATEYSYMVVAFSQQLFVPQITFRATASEFHYSSETPQPTLPALFVGVLHIVFYTDAYHNSLRGIHRRLLFCTAVYVFDFRVSKIHTVVIPGTAAVVFFVFSVCSGKRGLDFRETSY